jgi:kynurenine formamidase
MKTNEGLVTCQPCYFQFPSIPRSSFKVFDLTYNLDSNTIFWPGGESFNLCMSCYEVPDASRGTSYDYAAGVITCAEHGGTHVDAPFHFAKDQITVDRIPLNKLIGQAKVIDISDKTSSDRNYVLDESGIQSFEENHGLLQEGDVVLLRTGWSKYYKDGPKAYLGFDERVDGAYDSASSELSFPGIGERAAQMFVERKIAAVGLDTGRFS